MSCNNSDFEFDILAVLTKVKGSESILYDPVCALKFIDNVFINPSISEPASDYDQMVRTFLYQGCSMVIDDKLFVTAVGLKHLFSSFIAIRLVENKREMDRKHAKFMNWILKFDLDSFFLKGYY